MKKILVILLVFLAPRLSSQSKPYVFGAEFSNLLPMGTLQDRWDAAPAYSVYFGIRTSEKWIWSGRAEYFKFTDQNKDNLFIPYSFSAGSAEYLFRLPLDKLRQDLTVGGVALNAKYLMVQTEYCDLNLDLGFGLYNWTYNRNGYDSVYVDTTLAGSKRHLVAIKNVSSNSQTDWSGGFMAGLEVCIKPVSVFQITITADYKNIIGEIWPALTYNFENISTFQMLDLHAGIRVVL